LFSSPSHQKQSKPSSSDPKALIRKADNLACQSWNERMWSDGGPAQPSPTIGQAINGGFPWLEAECSRCKTMGSVDLAILRRPQHAPVHTLEGALRCRNAPRPNGDREASCISLRRASGISLLRNSMFEFFKSDVGKVALGSMIAVAGQPAAGT
jgi:hypothetical protein